MYEKTLLCLLHKEEIPELQSADFRVRSRLTNYSFNRIAVRGTDVMTRKKDMILHSMEQLENGVDLNLSTDDKELQGGIQKFMQFQGMEHKGH